MPMRLVSIDIFDTLLTRLVAAPKDLFILVGAQLEKENLLTSAPENFARQRIAAEATAASAHTHRQPNFDEIYLALQPLLNWNPTQTEAAKKIELATERAWLRVAPACRLLLDKARTEADQVVFLSDMYLPTPFLQSLLEENNLWQNGDQLFVSGETRCSKSLGDIFPFLRQKFGEVTSWRHYGDNPHSDVSMPQRHGIQSEHLNACALTRYESTFRPPHEEFVPLWRSKIAGAIRFARLNNPATTDHLRHVWNIGASVTGPFLFGFVKWILEEASRHQIQRLYFVARDGQILARLAQLITAKWNIPIEPRYLYGSRQAWRPAAHDKLDDFFKRWALAFLTPTDLQAIFKRLQLHPTDFTAELAAAGFPANTWRDPLDNPARERLWTLIQKPPFAEAAISQRQRQRALAAGYLRQEGFADDIPIGFVDVGWHGSMQLCLEAAASDFPARQFHPIHGFYVGLLHQHSELAGRTHSYWRETPGALPLHHTNFSLFERFTAANHGSTRGYLQRGEKFEPDLETSKNAPIQNWGIDTFQSAILKFAETALEILRPDEIPSDDYFLLTRKNFDLFAEHPTHEEARAFGDIPLNDQENEGGIPKLVPDLTHLEILRALRDPTRLPGWWREGTLALKPNPFLYLFLRARKLRRRIKTS